MNPDGKSRGSRFPDHLGNHPPLQRLTIFCAWPNHQPYMTQSKLIFVHREPVSIYISPDHGSELADSALRGWLNGATDSNRGRWRAFFPRGPVIIHCFAFFFRILMPQVHGMH